MNPAKYGDKTKKIRVPGGKTRIHRVKKKHSKHRCNVCNGIVHGAPHGKGKCCVANTRLSRRKPSAPFAGVLCGGCRKAAAEETAKIALGMKEIYDVESRLRPYVAQMGKEW